MKHIIGKRNGKTIVSGGGSLEEQKNNLKYWEVLDEESSPVKEQYNKRIKIRPQDLYLLIGGVNDIEYSRDTLFTPNCASNTIIGELSELPSKYEFLEMGEPIVTSNIKNTESFDEDQKKGVIIEGLCKSINIYRPIWNEEEKEWQYIVPVTNGLSVIDGFGSKVECALIIGCPLHYVESFDDEGNVKTKVAPNGTSREACVKRYGIPNTIIGNSDFINLVYNPVYTDMQLTIDTVSGSTATITKVEAANTDSSVDLAISGATIGYDLIPYQIVNNEDDTYYNNSKYEIPNGMKIIYKAISDNA